MSDEPMVAHITSYWSWTPTEGWVEVPTNAAITVWDDPPPRVWPPSDDDLRLQREWYDHPPAIADTDTHGPAI